MRCAIHKLALMLFVVCSLTGSAETVPQRELFSASFTNDYYTPGVQLCDTGTFHGTWGRVPDGAAIAEEDVASRKKYMACSTSGDGIAFTPTLNMSEWKIYSSVVTIRTQGYEDLSQIPCPTNARAAFAIHTPEDRKAHYKGWVCSQNCWTNLCPASGSSILATNKWMEVMVRFLKQDDDANDGYVQYWLKRPEYDVDFVPLKTEDGVSWIRTGVNVDSQKRGKIGFVGDGGLERILGQETRRGLIVGVGSWYKYLFDESIYVHYNINQGSGDTNWWANTGGSAMIRSDELRSYVIDVDENGDPVICHTPRRHAKEIVEVTEIEAQFASGNDDDSIPSNACARVRLVELPDETYRFACLADRQWKTNTTWVVDVSAKYTVEISLDNGNRTVTYRYKEGYGLEGGAYRDLCSGEMLPPPDCSGKTLQVDFDGYGIVHKIKGRDN